jgi:hypothetical protein
MKYTFSFFLALLFLLVNTVCLYGQDTTVKFGANTFLLSAKPADDTIWVDDPFTHKTITHISPRERIPMAMNGQKIYADTELVLNNKKYGSVFKTPGWTAQSIREYLLSNLKNEFKKLDDYDYELSLATIVIDDKGGIAYFNYGGFTARQKWNKNGEIKHNIPAPVLNEIKKKVYRLLLTAPPHEPAYAFGRPAASLITDISAVPFQIKSHKLVSMHW